MGQGSRIGKWVEPELGPGEERVRITEIEVGDTVLDSIWWREREPDPWFTVVRITEPHTGFGAGRTLYDAVLFDHCKHRYGGNCDVVRKRR